MKLQEIIEIANDTGVHAERGYHLKNFANRIVELDRQQRPWVGLTDEEINDCMSMSIQKTCRTVEAKLKEKNT